jgi:hypothetical protein
MCINLVTIYCISRLAIFYSATILRPGQVRGLAAGFSNFPWAGARPGPGERSLVSFHIVITTVIWTKLVKYWRSESFAVERVDPKGSEWVLALKFSVLI